MHAATLVTKAFSIVLVATAALLLAASCTSSQTSTPPTAVPFPIAQPELTVPPELELTGSLIVLQNQKVEIDADVEDYSFQGCEVWVISDNTQVSSSEFVNCTVYVAHKSNIVFDKVIFRELNQFEKAALNLYDCERVVVKNSEFVDNYIGLGIHGSSAELEASRFEGNNGHNALVR